MTPERKHEIGYLLLLQRVAKEGVELDAATIRRNAGREAKEMGISLEEMLDFYRAAVPDLTRRCLEGLSKTKAETD